MPKALSTLLLLAALLAGAFARAAPATAASEEERRVWASPSSCREVVALEHGRMAQAAAAPRLRVAAWNIEWFPDHTDIGWLACAIAWMNLDLLGIVDIRDGEGARARMGELLAELERSDRRALAS